MSIYTFSCIVNLSFVSRLKKRVTVKMHVTVVGFQTLMKTVKL